MAALRVVPRQNFRPMIHVTRADFDAMTHGRALCDAEGAINATGFEAMMREQARTPQRTRRASSVRRRNGASLTGLLLAPRALLRRLMSCGFACHDGPAGLCLL